MGIEINVAGEGFQLTVELVGWESPELMSGSDANWITGNVELKAGATGRYTARQAVSIRTDELLAFRDHLAGVLESLNGTAKLEHLEAKFGLKVTLESGAGELEAFVSEKLGPRLAVDGVPTDQSYLARTLRDVNEAVREFSPRGDVHG